MKTILSYFKLLLEVKSIKYIMRTKKRNEKSSFSDLKSQNFEHVSLIRFTQSEIFIVNDIG
jgi:hypothetical protein